MDPTVRQWRFKEGDEVFDCDGHKLGKVVGLLPDYTQPNYLVVEKGLIFHTDFYIPVGAIANYDQNSKIWLDVTKDEALGRGWDTMPSAVENADAPMARMSVAENADLTTGGTPLA